MNARVLLACSGLLLSTPAWADGEVSGVLFAQADGGPMAGLTVAADGHAQAVTTDADGAFLLSLPAGTWTLRVSGEGAQGTVDVTVADGQVTEVIATVDASALTDVSVEAPPAIGAGPVELAPDVVTGTLSGQVLDSDGKTVAAARIFVRGQAVETITDAEGRFELAVPPGSHTISVLHRSYATQTLAELSVTAGGTTPVSVSLVAAGVELEAFVVLAPAIDGGTASLLAERQNTSDVVDTVSAEEMSRRGDSSAASALKRVTGLTVVGGKYIYVRGMGERYAATLLNGSPLPSPEPTRRVVPLDLFPTAMLESVVVQKTFSPSMPADFGGGVLQLRTRGIPDEPVAKFGASVGHSAGTTGEMGLLGAQYDGDYWGGAFGNGGTAARLLPQGFAQQTQDTPLVIKSALPGAQGFSIEEMEDLSKSLPNNWGLSQMRVPYDLGMNASLGKGWDVGDQGRIGALVGFTFNNAWEKRTYHEVYPKLNSGELEIQNEYDFEDLSNLVQMGAMGVLEGRIGDEHSIRSTTFIVSDSEYLGRQYIGQHADIGETIRVQRSQWIARQMLVQQAVGEHHFPELWNAFLDWRLTWAGAGRQEPDRRDIIMQPTEDGGWRMRTQGGGNGMLYSNLDEESADIGVDFGFDLGDRDAPERFSATLQGGVASMERWRGVDVRRFSYDLRTTPGESDTSFLNAEPAQIFVDDNISATQGLLLAETTAGTDNSEGRHKIGSVYAQIELRAPWGMTVQTGARKEDSVQSVRTFTLHQQPPEVVLGEVAKVDVLPSATVTQKLPFDVRGSMQVRAGYGRTLNRPSLRELSPAVYFGVVGGREVAGDPTITRALIDNYDFRWEWYLSGNESLSIGAFSKQFTDPIETNILRGAAAREVPVNATGATNTGLEFDLRKSLGFGSGSGWDDLIVSSNASFIRSAVDLSGAEGAQTSSERPLQGQSPYVVNLQLSYEPVDFPLWGTLLYNAQGPRIVEVGTNGLPDTYEQPAKMMDAVLGWTITDGWSARLKAGNILDAKTTANVGRMLVRSVAPGRSVGLSVSWGYPGAREAGGE